ncbi:MAG: septum formation family protein [Actinomadura sp.]
MAASPLSRVMLLIALVLLTGCSSGAAGKSAAGGATTPRSATPSASSPSANTGPFQVGECVDFRLGAKGWGSCDREHDYEVMLAQRLPEKATGNAARRIMSRACYAVLPTYLRSPDAHASRLQAASAGPSQGEDGARWFACLVSEEGPDGDPVRRMGTLAGALAGGLGAFQKCLVGEPLADDPVRIVPCDRPHRSEAVPGVLVLGAPTDPPPGLRELTSRAFDHCKKAVDTYLGGSRPGVRPSGISPLPEEWPDGDTSAICYAVTKNLVTGSLRGR